MIKLLYLILCALLGGWPAFGVALPTLVLFT
jgi:hypothetical protein